VVKEHPNIAALDIMKEVGRVWQNIRKEELEYFKDKSKKDMDRYWKEHACFINEINHLRARKRSDLEDPMEIGEEPANEKLKEEVPISIDFAEDEEIKEPSFHRASIKRKPFEDWSPIFDDELPACTPLKDRLGFGNHGHTPGIGLTTPSTYHDEFLTSPSSRNYNAFLGGSQQLWGQAFPDS